MLLSRHICTGALVTLAVVLSAAPYAQTDRFPDLWVTDLRVEGMAVLGDTVFVAGRFRQVGPPTGQLAVLDKQTGEADTDFPNVTALGLGTQGVLVTLPDGAGGYYIGGDFSFVAGQSRLNLARVLPDGTLDPDFRPDPEATVGEGFVRALALDGGALYVGGGFDTIGGGARHDLAAVDAVTGALLPFDAALSGSDPGSIFQTSDVLARNGVIYVGGDFTTVAGQPRPNAVAVDGATGAILPWGAVPNGPAFPVAAGDGSVYLYGDFSAVNGQPRPFLAEVALFDPTTGGGAVTPWVPQQETFGSAFVTGGLYLWVANVNGPALQRVDRASGAVAVVQAGVSNGRALAFDPEGGPDGTGTLYLGAERALSPGGDRYPVVVAIDPATSQPTGFEAPGATEGNRVNALAVEPGPTGRLFAGGTFITFGTGITPRQGLAAFSLTTGRPTAFAATVTGPGQGLFEDLALAPDGRFLYGYSTVAGGAALRLTEFDLATGTTREFVPDGLTAGTYGASAHVAEARARPARVRRASTLAAPNPRVENATSALVATDDRLCVSLSGVACYDRETAALLYYTPMVYVGTISENNGDLVYLPAGGPVQGPGAGGTLFLAAPVEEAPVGTSRPALVAVDFETGAVLEQWTPGFAFPGAEGYALALLDPDGAGPARTALYAGGDREWTVQGADRRGLATFDPLTAALGPWAPTVSGGPVLTMAAHNTPASGGETGGVVYAGGSFRFIGNVIVPTSTAAFDAVTGAYLAEWNPGTGVSFVSLVSARHDAVFLGGNFGDSPRGSGHAGLTGVSPARPLLPTAGEADAPEVTRAASVALAGPNPLRSRTALSVSLPSAQTVEAGLYDVLGRRVAVLHAGPLPAGESRIEVDASGLPAGVYVARVTGAGVAAVLTLTVVR